MKDQNQNNFLAPVVETEVPELPRRKSVATWRMYGSQRPAFNMIYKGYTFERCKERIRNVDIMLWVRR